MARFKKPKGQTPVSKQLKKKLATKRSYGKNTSLNESSNNNVEENVVHEVRLSGGVSSSQTHIARKSIVDGNNFSERTARKSIVSGNENVKHSARKLVPQTARKSMEKGNEKLPYAHKTIQGPDASLGIGDAGISSETSKNVPVKVKKTRKSGIHLRPLAVSHRNHRRKSGVLALQQIRYYQKEVGLLMPKLNFQRVVREILNDFTSTNYRIQREALVALQEAAEMHLVRKFEDSQLCAIHANRVTVMIRDFALLKSLQD